MKSKSKKLLSTLLALSLVFGMFAAMPMTANAADATALSGQILAFFQGGTHGGTVVSPFKTSISGSTLTVEGEVSNAATGVELNIDSGVTVIWKAKFSGNSSNALIFLTGSGTFEVAQGGTLINIGGNAIFSQGANAKIIVSGGTVNTSGIPLATAIYSRGDGSAITVNSGSVSAENKENYAICTDGTGVRVVVDGGTVSSSGVDGKAIFSRSQNTEIVIDSGTVSSKDEYRAIRVEGDNSAVYVNGGTVTSVSSKYGVKCSVKVNGGTMKSIWTDGFDSPITILGGTVGTVGSNASPITITGGIIGPNPYDFDDYTIYRNNAPLSVTTFTMSGGFVFGSGTDIIGHYDHVISFGKGPETIDGTAVIVAWDKPSSGTPAYTAGTSEKLAVAPTGATAVWDKQGAQSGIKYKNGSNTGFFPISGVTINAAAPVPTPFTVTFNSNGGSAVASQTVNSGGKATKPADPTKGGVSFGGWYTDAALTTAYNFNNAVTSDLTLYAKWTANTTPAPTSTPTSTPTQPSTEKIITMKINDPFMYVNGVKQEIDPGRGTVPMIINSRTLVPIRAIVEAMGGTVGWEASTRTITLAASGHNVTMWLDKTNMIADGVNKTMDVAPVSINSRTMVPVRFAAENLGCTVDWDDPTKQVTIKY